MSAAAVTVATGGTVLIMLSISPPVILFTSAPIVIPIVHSATAAFTTIRTHTIPIAIAVPLAIAFQHHRGAAAAGDSFRTITVTIGAVHVAIVVASSFITPRSSFVPFVALFVLLGRIDRCGCSRRVVSG